MFELVFINIQREFVWVWSFHSNTVTFHFVAVELEWEGFIFHFFAIGTIVLVHRVAVVALGLQLEISIIPVAIIANSLEFLQKLNLFKRVRLIMIESSDVAHYFQFLCLQLAAPGAFTCSILHGSIQPFSTNPTSSVSTIKSLLF